MHLIKWGGKYSLSPGQGNYKIYCFFYKCFINILKELLDYQWAVSIQRSRREPANYSAL